VCVIVWLVFCVAAGVLLFCRSSALDSADHFWWKAKFEHGTFWIPDPRSSQPLHSNNMMAALDDSSSFYNRYNNSRACQIRKGLWQTGQSFILAGFILSLPRPDPCGFEHLIHRERPVATHQPLRNCFDHLAPFSHLYDLDGNLACYRPYSPVKGERRNNLPFFRCPSVFAIAIVSLSCLKFPIFAK